MSPPGLLQSWLNAASAGLGLPDEPCRGCLTVLHELNTADGPLGLSRLAEAVQSLAAPEDSAGADAPCPDCGEVHGPPDPAVSSEICQGQRRVGLRRAARLPVLVRSRVRIPAQVPAEAQLQAPGGDPVPADGLRHAGLGP
jgi:hypothetical protein